MTLRICARCGVEDADRDEPLAVCPLCEDERNYVPDAGQVWTTQEELAARPYELTVREFEPGLFGLERSPAVGIGQRTFLLRTSGGNLLWDPPGYLDDRVAERVTELGGVAAIVPSHPHMFGAQVAWSHAFGGVPVWVNAADERWLARRDDVVRLWSTTQDVLPGVTLVQCGGHFPGSSVAHWRDGAGGAGSVLTGDTIGTVAAAGWVTFLRSYPNLIPLSPGAVERIVDRLEPYPYERLYALAGRPVATDAKGAVRRSAERYIGWVTGKFDADT